MGSQCSILNDTKHDVWIIHGINWQSLTTAVTILKLLAGATTPYTKVSPAVIFGIDAIGKYISDCEKEDKREKTNITSAKLIKPGEKYTWFGTLSLHMRVYAMTSINDDLQCKEKVCFTGPTANSEYVYSVSQHFEIN